MNFALALATLASIGAGVLGLHTLLKVVDLFRLEDWHTLFAGTWESWLYGAEIPIAALLPILLVLVPRTRRSPVGLDVAAFSAVSGVAHNRLDVGIFGYFSDAHTVYFPSLAEWALGIGVVAAAGPVFFCIVENKEQLETAMATGESTGQVNQEGLPGLY